MKSENEQMIQQIMDTDTMGYACVHDSGSSKREEYLVALTAENLANLIGGKSGKARQITVTDVLDRLVADSRMGTLGSCPDQRLCGEINQFRALIQRGEKGAGEILAVSRDAADEYFAAEGNAGILAEYQMLFFIYSISKR
ncbi:MAG: hypothetical protein HFI88_11120 [Lachnospiraceae bacterium]|nr:hypothetical protein [Lachnospiraceae bacterium]